MRPAALVSLLLFAFAAPAAAYDATYAKYDALLKRYVSPQGWVDYAGWKKNDEQALRACVRELGQVDVGKLDRFAKKAHWINVYNALTLQAMLEFFPLDSIKDKQSILPGGYKIWDDYKLNGKSLNQIEHEILRPMGDPRIHGAIVCASKGCPPLRPEAYVPSRLDAQLTDQCRVWLSDPRRGLEIEGDTASVSKVFDWFADDFPKGEQGRLRWIAQFVDDAKGRRLRSGELELDTLDWDWALNKQ